MEVRIFFIENQHDGSFLKNKIKKVLPVMKKAVLLHPQNTGGESKKLKRFCDAL